MVETHVFKFNYLKFYILQTSLNISLKLVQFVLNKW